MFPTNRNCHRYRGNLHIEVSSNIINLQYFRFPSQDIDEEDKDEESEQEETIINSKKTIILIKNSNL